MRPDSVTSRSLDPMCQKAAVEFRPLRCITELPSYLITQVKDLDIDVELYRAAIALSIQDGGLLYGLYCSDKLLGFLWCQLDPIENRLFVNCYSIDKSLWHTKEHIRCLIKLIEWLKTMLSVHKVAWFTTRPALYRRLGFKESKRVLMEA